MAFYHILVKAPSKLQCILFDLSEKELKEKFVTPYSKSQNIFYKDSTILQITEIKEVQIIQTQHCMEEELQQIFQNRPPQKSQLVYRINLTGSRKEDIVEAGKNVTSEYILGVPGFHTPSKFWDVVNHPWVVAIVGGIWVTVAGGVVLAFILG